MNTKDFYYELPQELIAQTPLKQRDTSRLLLLDKRTGETAHRRFYEVEDLLRPGDCLVLNDTRVIPARLIGQRKQTGAAVELLLLTRRERDVWEALTKPGKRAREGAELVFGPSLSARVEAVLENGNRLVRFFYEGVFEAVLDRLGQMPLPPYITEKLEDPNRYQTVYAKCDGSAAAPTAGLHFTPELLERIRQKGVSTAFLTLHVGLGTFRPVQVSDVHEHRMHAEYYELRKETVEAVLETKRRGGRVVAVGTTACRALESASLGGALRPQSGWTDIFIYPPYDFETVDALITNFHLPCSTLMMLVSALAGREHILEAYEQAIRERYRFFSFGDAMMIY